MKVSQFFYVIHACKDWTESDEIMFYKGASPEKTREVTSFLDIFCLLMPCSCSALASLVGSLGCPHLWVVTRHAGTAERDKILLRPACPGLVTSLVFSGPTGDSLRKLDIHLTDVPLPRITKTGVFDLRPIKQSADLISEWLQCYVLSKLSVKVINYL